MKKFKLISFSFLILLVLLCVDLWFFRISIASRMARKELDAKGFNDVSFSLSRLSPGGIGLRDVSIGKDASLADAEIRFNLFDALRLHRLEHLSVSGLCVRAVVGKGGKTSFPVLSRFQHLSGGHAKKGATTNSPALFPSIVSGRLEDLVVKAEDPQGRPLAEVAATTEFMLDSDAKYSIQTRVLGKDLFYLYLSGHVDAAAREGEFYPLFFLPDANRALAFAPIFQKENEPAAPLPVIPSNVSVEAHGRIRFWQHPTATNAPVEFELETVVPKCALLIPEKDADLGLQSCKIEWNGTPTNVHAKISTGFSGLRWGTLLEAREERRMFGLRGTFDWSKAESGQTLTANISSDLPGRFAAKVLPRVLPFIPSFFSDGGTVKAKIALTQTNALAAAGEGWSGTVGMDSEVLRSSIPTGQGMLGAKAVRIGCQLGLSQSRPTGFDTLIELDDISLFSRDVAAHCTLAVDLHGKPPFKTAQGKFRGSVSESRALALKKMFLKEGTVSFEGEAEVEGLLDATPRWVISARIPDSGLSITQANATASATFGASTRAVYCPASPLQTHVDAELHVTNAYAMVYPSTTNASQLSGSPLVTLRDMRLSLPAFWTPSNGLVLAAGQSFAWRSLSVQGLKILPESFSLTNDQKNLFLRGGARVGNSALAVTFDTRVPFTDPMSATVHVAMAETVLTNEDAAMRFALAKMPGVSGEIKAALHADVIFLGTRPFVKGRVNVLDGKLQKEKMSVSGLSADIPFSQSLFFRTQERPYFAFTNAVFGNLSFQSGKIDFQITPKELFIERVAVGWCNGEVNLYSAHLDWKNPKEIFTLYADKVNLGEALIPFLPVRGKMEGILYGRLPIGFDNGKINLHKGFLYSMPDSGGSLQIDDADDLAGILGQAGIEGDVQKPLARALGNMNFSVLKMDLLPADSLDKDSTLRIKIGGKSNDKSWPAPIDLELNLHGPLEGLINLGVNLNQKKKLPYVNPAN